MLSTNQIVVFFDHQSISYNFLHGDNHQRKLVSENATFCLVWLIVPLSNQNVGFFDHQYFWKESVDLIDFFAWR